VWGDFGLRMKDHDRRMPASALKIAEETIKRRLRGMNYKLYKRVSANIGVYTSGNEQRMGKGKGKFDYWTVRLPVSRIVFELKGDVHEKVAREAFRLAGHKLPGMLRILSLLESQSRIWMLIVQIRSLGICQQGRPSCRGNYKAWKRSYSRFPQARAQKPAPRYR
jgi:ribosomal protein L16